MVRRCRLPAGLDVQLISSKPRLVQMRRTGPRGAPQSTRTVAVAMRALIDTAQILLLASSERALNIEYLERAPVQNTSFRCRKQIGKHTSELQSQSNLVCRLLLEKKKRTHY